MAFGKKWKHSTGTKLYYIWRNMIRRCSNPKDDSWGRYGGRGITVCDEWNSYDRFADWSIQNGYKAGLSIERNDFNGNYEPENCRWITMYEQHSNECRNVFVEHNGERKTIAQWCRDLNFSEITAYARHSKYGANTFDELFCEHLLSHRVKNRENKCLVCDRQESVKWRKDGKLCNTCYHRGLRWSKKTGGNIDNYHEFTEFK
jgi:hypothetical protein